MDHRPAPFEVGQDHPAVVVDRHAVGLQDGPFGVEVAREPRLGVDHDRRVAVVAVGEGRTRGDQVAVGEQRQVERAPGDVAKRESLGGAVHEVHPEERCVLHQKGAFVEEHERLHRRERVHARDSVELVRQHRLVQGVGVQADHFARVGDVAHVQDPVLVVEDEVEARGAHDVARQELLGLAGRGVDAQQARPALEDVGRAVHDEDAAVGRDRDARELEVPAPARLDQELLPRRGVGDEDHAGRLADRVEATVGSDGDVQQPGGRRRCRVGQQRPLVRVDPIHRLPDAHDVAGLDRERLPGEARRQQAQDREQGDGLTGPHPGSLSASLSAAGRPIGGCAFLKQRRGPTDVACMQDQEPQPAPSGSRARFEATIGTGLGGALAVVAALGAAAIGGSPWLGAGAGLVCVGAVAFWAGRLGERSDRLVGELEQAARRMREGDQLERLDPARLGAWAGVADSFNHMLDALGGVAHRVLEVVGRVRGLPERIGEAVAEVEASAEAQEEAVEETASLLANINTSIGEINGQVDQLSRSADESASSILQMGSSVDEVARNAASLHESVEASTSAVHEMGASIRQVAEGAETGPGHRRGDGGVDASRWTARCRRSAST